MNGWVESFVEKFTAFSNSTQGNDWYLLAGVLMAIILIARFGLRS